MAAEPSSFIGRVIDGRYLVESVIGHGGMGVVLRAKHKFTSAQVALKMLNRELRLNTDVQERFLAEARTPSTIGHPGIVAVLDAGTTPDGELYFAMELLTGRTLRQALYPTVPPQVARRISLELLDALGAAHARGIIHRDLKPENVFLTNPTGTVKLLDFGIAKAIQTARTHQGQMLGTLAYMSPEQLMDASSVDARADLWAVGVMLYEMLAGKLPFRATSLVEMVEAFNTRDADPIRIHLAATPWLDKADAFFARALARDRTQRFGSTQEMAGNLAALGLDEVSSAGSTLAGMVASHVNQLTAADSGPSLPRSAGMPAQHVMTAADSGPSLPRTGASPIAQPHGTPSTAYTPRGTQQGSGMPNAAAVRAAVAHSTQQGSAIPARPRPPTPSVPPPNDPFPPANAALAQGAVDGSGGRAPMVATLPVSGAPAPNTSHMVATMPAPMPSNMVAPMPAPRSPQTVATLPVSGAPSSPHMVPTLPVPSTPQLFGLSNQPVAPTIPGASAPRNRSPSAVPPPSAPYVPQSALPDRPSAPYVPQSAPPSDRPSAPYVPQSAPPPDRPSAQYVPQSGSPSAPYAVPSARPSAPYVPQSGSPSAPFAVPERPSAPYVPQSAPPDRPSAPNIPVVGGRAHHAAPYPNPPTSPGAWNPPTQVPATGGGGLSQSAWIVLGIVAVAFIGLIVVLTKMF